MQNLTAEICAKFKEARKAKGLNQSALAQAVGCKQSAVSMFEAGMATKLSDEAVGKMAELLGLDLAAMLKADEERRKAHGGIDVLPVMAAGVINPGDVILVEDPSFLGNLQCMHLYQAKLVPVPSDEHGLLLHQIRLKKLLVDNKQFQK